MMNDDAISDPKQPNVATSAIQCLESFRECLLRASSVHPRESSRVEDQTARFTTWATSVGIFALGRTSIDHPLRYAPEAQPIVAGLLESLDYRIRTCSITLGSAGKPSTAKAPTGPSDVLDRSFGDIASEISRLIKVSSTIRKASKATQIHKAREFQIKDETGNNVEMALLGDFEHFIHSRLPNISDTMRRRLTYSMLFRRKQVLYRRCRQGNTAIRPQYATIMPQVTPAAAQPKDSRVGSVVAPMETKTLAGLQLKGVTSPAPDKFTMAGPSQSTISVSKKVVLGNRGTFNFPPAPGIAAKRKYEQLTAQREVDLEAALEKLEHSYGFMTFYGGPLPRQPIAEAKASMKAKFQDTLKSDLEAVGEITCPYCLHAIPAEEAFDDKRWQNHVNNDLDPYICLFEDCDQPYELYSHREEWLAHLHQHDQHWRCYSHPDLGRFSIREDYIRHLRESHNMKLSDTQFRVLANRSVRKTTPLFISCPLCDQYEIETDGLLEDHIAHHLKSLALESLPSYQENTPDGEGSKNGSGGLSHPRHMSSIKNLVDTMDHQVENARATLHHALSMDREECESPRESLSINNILEFYSAKEAKDTLHNIKHSFDRATESINQAIQNSKYIRNMNELPEARCRVLQHLPTARDILTFMKSRIVKDGRDERIQICDYTTANMTAQRMAGDASRIRLIFSTTDWHEPGPPGELYQKVIGGEETLEEVMASLLKNMSSIAYSFSFSEETHANLRKTLEKVAGRSLIEEEIFSSSWVQPHAKSPAHHTFTSFSNFIDRVKEVPGLSLSDDSNW